MERHKSIYYQLYKTCAFPKFVSALNTFLKEVLLSKPEDRYYVCTNLGADSLFVR